MRHCTYLAEGERNLAKLRRSFTQKHLKGKTQLDRKLGFKRFAGYAKIGQVVDLANQRCGAALKRKYAELTT